MCIVGCNDAVADEDDDDHDDDDDDDYDDDDDDGGDDDDVAMMMTWHMPCHRCVENDMQVAHYEPAWAIPKATSPRTAAR